MNFVEMINNFDPEEYISKRKEELSGAPTTLPSPATTPSHSFIGNKTINSQIDETNEKIIKNEYNNDKRNQKTIAYFTMHSNIEMIDIEMKKLSSYKMDQNPTIFLETFK